MDTQRLVRDVVAMLGGALAASTPDATTQAVVDKMSAELSPTPWGGGVLHGFLQSPSDPNRQDMLAAALRELANADPAFAQYLTDALKSGRDKAPMDKAAPITVTAGGDQRFRAPVNIGSGTLSVDRSRKFDLKIGLGGLAVLLAAGGATTGIVLSQGGTDTVAGPVVTTTPIIAGKPQSIGESGQLPEAPYDEITDIYRMPAEGYPPSRTCLMFSDVAAGEFATANGTSSCPAAFAKLKNQITDANVYAEPGFGAFPTGPLGDVDEPVINDGIAVVSTCALTVSGGPRLQANVTLTKQDRGWLITGYQKIACP